MLIKRIFYPLKTLGSGTRIGIWTSGCLKRCPGCMSRHLQIFDKECEIKVESLLLNIEEVLKKNISISGVTISGGEPFDQEDLPKLLSGLKKMGINDILIYTGYTYAELLKSNNLSVTKSLDLIDVLIDGEYVAELNDDKSLRGSSNQTMHIFNENLRDKYLNLFGREKRRFQIVVGEEEYTIYGVPPKRALQKLEALRANKKGN